MNKKLFNNIKTAIYFIRLARRLNLKYLFALVLSCMCKASIPFINTIVPKFIIEELMGDKDIQSLIKYSIILVLLNSTLYLLKQVLDEVLLIQQEKFMNSVELDIGIRIMNAEYSIIEDPVMMDLKEKALFPLLRLRALKLMMEQATDVMSNIIIIFGMVGVLATLDIKIVILIASFSIAGIFGYKKLADISFVVNEMIIPINRKFTYYIHMITDYTRAKDIRIYNLENLISNKIKNNNRETYEALRKIDSKTFKCNIVNQVLFILQTILINIYIIYMVNLKRITIGQFTMYITAISQFIFGTDKIIKLYVDFSENCEFLKKYIEFVEKLESKQSKLGIELQNDITKIEFENISFKYSQSDNLVLKNISFTINKGEKVSIVGLNGAGKSTIVKLLLRLYKPTTGNILVNGINIEQYSIDSYLQKFGVVFQDFKLFAFNVKENICLNESDNFDDKQVWEVIEKIGLQDKLQSASKGLYTDVLKYFSDDGLEFSGGQAQRLAIGRLLIKEFPIMIMDEPTSALDPVTEAEIFNIFNNIIDSGEKRIAIYISHRLSSCQFSDKIIVINNNKIEQMGNHKELVNANGVYKIMWRKQAQYYA